MVRFCLVWVGFGWIGVYAAFSIVMYYCASLTEFGWTGLRWTMLPLTHPCVGLGSFFLLLRPLLILLLLMVLLLLFFFAVCCVLCVFFVSRHRNGSTSIR